MVSVAAGKSQTVYFSPHLPLPADAEPLQVAGFCLSLSRLHTSDFLTLGPLQRRIPGGQQNNKRSTESR